MSPTRFAREISSLILGILTTATAGAAQEREAELAGSLRWGRLVDVLATDAATGRPAARAELRDLLVGEAIGVARLRAETAPGAPAFTLREDPASGLAFLLIGAPFDADPASPFARALAEARAAVKTIPVALPDSLPPIPSIPRDAAIELRFSAPLGARAVADVVRIEGTGGAEVPGRFIGRSSEPASLVFSPRLGPGALARAAEAGPQGGQRLAGATRSSSGAFPAAPGTGASVTVVQAASGRPLRAFRAGAGAGLPAAVPFTILGVQPLSLVSVGDADPSTPGDDHSRITFEFAQAACDLDLAPGDAIEQGDSFAIVTAILASAPLHVVDVLYSQGTGFVSGRPALVTTSFTATPAAKQKAACYLSLRPAPLASPAAGVDPALQIGVRFSRPVDPESLDPLENVSVVLDPALDPTTAGPRDVAVAQAHVWEGAPDAVTYASLLPLPHRQGESETLVFHVLGGSKGIRDVDGNPLAFGLLDFRAPIALNPAAPSSFAKGLVLRFDSIFEGGGPAQSIAGQWSVPAPGALGGRPVSHFSRYADPSQPVVAAMASFTVAGVQAPLVPLGSRSMTVYRHVDLGLEIDALADLDLDVEGLAWTTFPTGPFADYFPQIRIDASHSRFAPDEMIEPMTLLPRYPESGLSVASFGANLLDPAGHPASVLYGGAYAVNPNDSIVAPSGLRMLPYPKFASTYTWRDTSYPPALVGGANGAGVNPDSYFAVLGQFPSPAPSPKRPYGPGAVPSAGLPLLLDFRTWPSSDPATQGLNSYFVALAVNSSSKPNFRVLSAGGVDTQGVPQAVVPDVAPAGTIPAGSYVLPGGYPFPGLKTPPGGPEFSYGRVDFGIRHSRVYTHFHDLGPGQPQLSAAQVVLVGATPPGTAIALAYRGADSATSGSAGDARCFDAYGRVYAGNGLATVPPPFFGAAPNPCGSVAGAIPSEGFANDPAAVSGKRFLQLRLTFTGDLATHAAPVLASLGVAYTLAGP